MKSATHNQLRCLVDCSYSTQQGAFASPTLNSTNGVRGSFILSLQNAAARQPGSLLSNPTNAVGGSFILDLQHAAAREPPASLKSHQRCWWIVHTRPTKRGRKSAGPLLSNPTNAVGGLLILDLQNAAQDSPARFSQIPPTLLVDCSYSTYKTRPQDSRPLLSNPTNAVGGSFILDLQNAAARQPPASLKSHQRSWWIVHTRPTKRGHKSAGPLLSNPTNAVGGLFILDLQNAATRAPARFSQIPPTLLVDC